MREGFLVTAGEGRSVDGSDNRRRARVECRRYSGHALAGHAPVNGTTRAVRAVIGEDLAVEPQEKQHDRRDQQGKYAGQQKEHDDAYEICNQGKRPPFKWLAQPPQGGWASCRPRIQPLG